MRAHSLPMPFLLRRAGKNWPEAIGLDNGWNVIIEPREVPSQKPSRPSVLLIDVPILTQKYTLTTAHEGCWSKGNASCLFTLQRVRYRTSSGTLPHKLGKVWAQMGTPRCMLPKIHQDNQMELELVAES